MVSIGRSAVVPFSLSNSLLFTKSLHNNYNISNVSLLSPNKTHKSKTHLSLVLNPFSFSTNPLFTFHKTNNGLCLVSALKKSRKGGPTRLMEEMDGSDEDDDFVDDDDDDDDEDEDEEMFLPFGKMKKWLENKPRGFGEGKVYDTSIEDKLFEELERSREAQGVNIDKLKSNPVKPGSKKDNSKAPEVIPSGIRVRLTNLPKKKNIHRDLKSAFEEVPGIINIVPAVSGNKKTKDPICKGFAFVDFKSEEDATRFVQIFARESIAFGKIQKQIKCEMTNSHSPNSVHEQAAAYTYIVPEPKLPDLEEDPTDSEMDDSSLDLSAETASDSSDNLDDEFAFGKLQKQIKCEMTNSHSPNSVHEQAAAYTYIVPEPTLPDLEEDPTDSEMDDSSLDLWAETASDASDDPDDEFGTAKLEDIRKNLESVSVSVQNGGDSMEPTTKFQANSISSNPLERIRALEKKLLAKGKVEKVRKLKVPGSAKRKNLESVSVSVQNGGDSMEPATKSQTNSISSNPLERIQALEKRLLVKGKVEKVRKLEVPGSAKRKNLESISVSVQNGGDSMEPATKFQTNSISSNPLERIRALEKKLLAKGKLEKVQKLKVQRSAKRENLESVSVSVQNEGDSMEPASKFHTNSISSNRQEKIRTNENKLLAKGKVEKVRKLEVPGSAKRLKMREKAVLTGVFSKYGVKAASTSKEES